MLAMLAIDSKSEMLPLGVRTALASWLNRKVERETLNSVARINRYLLLQYWEMHAQGNFFGQSLSVKLS